MKKAKSTRVVAFLVAVCLTFGMLITGASASTEYEDRTEDIGVTTTAVYSSTGYKTYLSSQLTLLREKKSTKTDEQVLADNKPSVGTVYSVDIAEFTPDSVETRKNIYVNGVNSLNSELTLAGYESVITAEHPVSVYLPEQGTVSWNVNVETAGFYGVRVYYYPLSVNNKFSTAEKKLLIDDELLFSECTSLTFDKEWTYEYIYNEDENGEYVFVTDAAGIYQLNNQFGKYILASVAAAEGKTPVGDKRYTRAYDADKNGNDIRSDCDQTPVWKTYTLQDNNGFVDGDLQIYFTAGTHKISLEGTREGLVVSAIELFVTESEISYAEYTQNIAEKYPNAKAGTGSMIMEAELPDSVSDASVYASNDRSSAINSPNNPSAELLNVIGKESYKTVGQWATYTFTVEEDGLYNLAARFKQTALEGMFASRTLKLSSSDGEFGEADGTPTVPFSEAYRMRFNYLSDWQSNYFGYYDTVVGEDGVTQNIFHEFTFHFKKGVVYTICLEVGLGDMADIINTVQNSLTTINNAYLNILKLTGTSPDEYRSYNFSRVMPNTVKDLYDQSKVLADVVNRMKNICGATGSNTATLTTIALLLEKMGSDEDEIASNLSNLKSYIGNLGTWLNTAKEQSITFDYIRVQPENTELPVANANFFQSAWFEICAFFASFWTDYSSMGVRSDTEKIGSIDVWLAYGRDQSKIWRGLIDDQFTSVTGVAVTLKLVTGGTLLPSVLCGKGPDVYIGTGASETINYAIRSAITPLTQFEDLQSFIVGEDASKPRFAASAMVPLTLYNEVYGIPETSNFNMMFVRNDVLENLGIEVPETWDDVLEAVPVFQANNMQVGINYATAFNIFLYQRQGGLWLYNGTDGYAVDDVYAGAQIGISTNTALDAFADVCRLYTDYSFPVSYDGSNRFRTGEMPILIADYVGTYNTLTVFATEISGMWQFTQIPGTENLMYNEDGTPTLDVDGNQKSYIDHSSMTSVTATVILHSETRTEEKTQFAWEFIKWQCGDEAQAEYGNKMVALIGPSAKYATANTHAIEDLSWTSAEINNIRTQLDALAAIENYPGSYYISRYIQFAFLDAYNDGMDAADAIQSYINTINKEITRKRTEFELKTLEIGETPEEARAKAAE